MGVLFVNDHQPVAAWQNGTMLSGWQTVQEKSGEIVSFDRTYNAAFDGLEIAGATEQVTTTGAQLFDANHVTGVSNAGLEINDTDGYLSISGTASKTVFLTFDFPLALPEKTVITCGFISNFPIENTGAGQCTLRLKITSTEETTVTNLVSVYGASNASGFASVADGYTAVNLHWRIPAGITLDNYKIRIMLNSGAAALPWEPYTGGAPSPSPDYPQPFADASGTITDGHNTVTIPSLMDGVSYKLSGGKAEKVETKTRTLSADGLATGYQTVTPPITTDITDTPLGQQLLSLACHYPATTLAQTPGAVPLTITATAKTF